MKAQFDTYRFSLRLKGVRYKSFRAKRERASSYQIILSLCLLEINSYFTLYRAMIKNNCLFVSSNEQLRSRYIYRTNQNRRQLAHFVLEKGISLHH